MPRRCAVPWIRRSPIIADGRLEQAMLAYRAAIDREPELLDALAGLAQLLVQLSRLPEAEAVWRDIIRQQPDLAGAHNNLGATLRSLHRPAEAVECFRAALRLQPFYAEASNNLGAALCELGQFEESIAHFLAALKANPQYPKALCNLASALRDLRRFDEALTCLGHALRLAPDFAEAHFNASQVLLLNGQMPAGWTEYEWRMSLPIAGQRRAFAAPAWRGGPTGELVVLLHAEAGLGDTIQFCRYVPQMARAGHRVILEVQKPLQSLLASLPGALPIIAAGDPLPQHDLQCPLMSLPMVFGTTPQTIPGGVPYLHAEAAAVARWQQTLAPLAGRRIGLVWAGNPDYLADLRRSLPLAALAPLTEIEDIAFVSLQKGEAGSAPPPPGMVLHDWTERLTDMAETAALIMALDLVITVDTAVAHLAGALGRPVWLLNRYDTDWRWLLDHDDSPWYPTMRIFRQQRAGDWSDPVRAVRDALRQRLNLMRPSAPAQPLRGEWQAAGSHDRLAAQALAAGDFEAALMHSEQALRGAPDVAWPAQQPRQRAAQSRPSGGGACRLSTGRRARTRRHSIRLNIASVLKDLGRIAEAEAGYRALIAAAPETAEPHAALGALLLEQGRLGEGWPEFAWRTRVATFRQRPFDVPVWDGTPAPDRTLLLHSDEGFGDAIQMCRYLPLVTQRIGVVLEAPRALAPLFVAFPGSSDMSCAARTRACSICIARCSISQ